MAQLKNKTLTGLIWSGIDSYGIYVVKFAFSISIARILEPKDYGLIGMMAIFIAVGSMVTDSGFQASILQKKEPSLSDYSSVFSLKIAISLIIYFILFASAESISNFYQEPQLINITKVISLGIVINAIGGIHQTWFIKNLNFKIITKINLISSAFSGSVGLLIAFLGYGVWAIVFQTLSGNVIRTILFWTNREVKFPFKINTRALFQLSSFGWKIFAQSVLNTLFSNIYYPLIGKYFNVVNLGYYTNARRFQQLAVSQPTTAISKVLFPTFSSIQDNKKKLAIANEKSIQLLIFISFPLITALILTTYPMVSFFLTSKWVPSVFYIQLLFLFGFVAPIHSMNMNVLNSIGKSDTTLKVNLINKILLLISIFIGINFEISGLIIFSLVATIITYLIGAYYVQKNIEYKLINQIKSILLTLFVCGIAFLIGAYSFSIFIVSDLIKLLLQVVIVFGVYYLIMNILKPKAYHEFKLIIKSYMKK